MFMLHAFIRNSPRFRLVLPLLGTILLMLNAFESGLFADPPPPEEADNCSDAPLAGSGQHSPQTIISAPFGTSFQVNVDAAGQNIVGDAANEPSICVDPNNPNRIAIGWRQFDNTNSNFRQSGVAYSTNGGVNWTFPGKLDAGVFRSDPVLASDANGVFYYLGISNCNTFNEDLFRSSDGGVTWQRIGDALGGDKEWMAIDTTSSPGHGNIYQNWQIINSFGSANFMFTRSTNGGTNWMTPIAIPHAAHFGTVDVGPNGEVYIIGWDGNSAQFWLNRSLNVTNSSVTPSFDLTVAVNLGGSQSGGGVNPAGLLGQAWLVVDRSTNQTRGNLYALCSTTASSNTCDVMFARSTNGGTSWSAPMRINDFGPNSYHWLGAIAVTPNGQRIDVCWYDTRNSSNNQFSELYYSYSMDGGLTWSANRAVSAPFDPSLGYPNQSKMGDYIGVVALNDATYVAYSATFNGEEDVYFLRMPDFPIQMTIANVGANNAISWNAIPGNTYCLQYKTSLNEPWPVGTNQICVLATNTQVTVMDTNLAGVDQRFYRVNVTVFSPGAPVINTQPASVTNYVSLATTFSVSAFGSFPLSYQWSKDGTTIPGATQNLLTFKPTAESDAGTYSVRVTNLYGFLDSTSAVLTVLPPPSSPPNISNLVLHLPFDNDLTDATGRGNNGTAIQVTTTSSNVSSAAFVSGMLGSALHYSSVFGSTNNANYVTLGVRPDLQFGSSTSFTVAYWIRLPFGYAGGDLPFFTDALNSTFGGGFCFAPSYGSGGWALSLFDAATDQNGIGVYGNAGSINDGNWHHLVHSIDRVNGMVTYLDGVAASYVVEGGSSVAAAGNIDTGRPANIGQDPSGKYAETGSADMDDLGVWRRALTALEAGSIYMAGVSNHLSFTGSP
jgi:hypothetical protein